MNGPVSRLDGVRAAEARITTQELTPMDVLATAAAIGLTADAGGDGLGTIEEDVVLAALSDLAAAHPEAADLFAEAAARVQLARSAGVERLDAGSVFAARRGSREIQLRYRSEMREIFTDLAIDLALRRPRVGAGA